MENRIPLCETVTCGKSAKVFSLCDSSKVACCEEHISLLLGKATKFFDISGYYFVSALEDVPVFEERKLMKEKGCGNLTVLEANCDSELDSALKAIQNSQEKAIIAVESRCEEMRTAVTAACGETAKQLALLRMELSRFLLSKESILSPTAEILCSDVYVTSTLVRFGLVDATDSVSAALSDSWIIHTSKIDSAIRCLDATQKNEAIQSALMEAIESARKGIPEALKYADLLIGDEELFEEEKNKVVSELLEHEEKRIKRNWEWLQRSWDLRKTYEIANKATIKVGQQFAKILYRQYGRFSEAEEVLQYCFDLSPSPEDKMSLSNNICDLYSASAQTEKLIELGLWTLKSFESANLPAEHYWTTLFYLIEVMNRSSKCDQAAKLLEDWRTRNLPGKNVLSETLQLLTCGVSSFNWIEIKEYMLPARRLCVRHFPTSIFTALAIQSLAFTFGGDARAEQYRREAHSIWAVIAPKSTHAAFNLYSLGELLQTTRQRAKAEECYRQVQSILEVAAPISGLAGHNFLKIGLLEEAKEQIEEAMVNLEKARSIFTILRDKYWESVARGHIFRLRI